MKLLKPSHENLISSIYKFCFVQKVVIYSWKKFSLARDYQLISVVENCQTLPNNNWRAVGVVKL